MRRDRNVVAHPEVCDPFGKARQGFEQRFRTVRQGHVHESFPGPARQLPEPEPGRCEVGRLLHERRTDQLAVELVGPGMIRTADPPGMTTSLKETRRSVQANVDECPNASVSLPDCEHRCIHYVPADVVTGRRHLRFPADADPVPSKQAFDFEFEYLRVVIDGRRARAGLAD